MVWNPAIEWTGGGLISNSCDLARWAKLLYEGRAMPADYLGDLLQSVPTDSDISKNSYGLGVAIEKTHRLACGMDMAVLFQGIRLVCVTIANMASLSLFN